MMDETDMLKNLLPALKKAVLDRMSYLGLDAVFVKEQEECYGLGCRTTETILEYLGDSVILVVEHIDAVSARRIGVV